MTEGKRLVLRTQDTVSEALGNDCNGVCSLFCLGVGLTGRAQISFPFF